jgi:hypothetical protein
VAASKRIRLSPMINRRRDMRCSSRSVTPPTTMVGSPRNWLGPSDVLPVTGVAHPTPPPVAAFLIRQHTGICPRSASSDKVFRCSRGSLLAPCPIKQPRPVSYGAFHGLVLVSIRRLVEALRFGTSGVNNLHAWSTPRQQPRLIRWEPCRSIRGRKVERARIPPARSKDSRLSPMVAGVRAALVEI